MASLIGKNAEVEGRAFALDREHTYVGRHQENHITLQDVSISHLHCIIFNQPEQLAVQDQDSTNGIRVNGEEIDEALLCHGDKLEVGDILFIIDAPEFPQGVYDDALQEEVDAAEPEPAVEEPPSSGPPSDLFDDMLPPTVEPAPAEPLENHDEEPTPPAAPSKAMTPVAEILPEREIGPDKETQETRVRAPLTIPGFVYTLGYAMGLALMLWVVFQYIRKVMGS